MPDNPKPQPGHHSQKWYKKRGLPVPNARNQQMGNPRPAPNKISKPTAKARMDTTLLVSIIFGVLALLGIVLQWNGVVTVPWKYSAVIYVVLSGLAVYSFWIWETAAKWRTVKRIIWVGIAALFFLGISSVGVVTQYRRENVTVITHTFENPDLVASDTENLPDVDLTKRPLIVGTLGDSLSCRPANGPVDNIYMMVSFDNRGIPTSLSGWKLDLEVPGYHHEFNYQEIKDSDDCLGTRGEVWKFKAKDAIYEKAEKLFPTGEIVRGWVKFTIPGGLYPLVPEQAKMNLFFMDYQFHKYSMTFHPTPGPQEFHFYPGIEDPRKR
jgi:hypothetical protein